MTGLEAMETIGNWLLNSAGAAAILSVFGFIFKDAISNHLSHKLSIKTSLSLNTQSKKIEAVEATFKELNCLSTITSVQIVQRIKMDNVVKSTDDPELQDWFSKLVDSGLVEKDGEKLSILSDEAKMLRKLYLDQETQDYFETYVMIVSHAMTAFKLSQSGQPLNREFITAGESLRKTITTLVPEHVKGFERYGDRYVFFLSQYFFDHTLTGLRAIANLGHDSVDAKSVWNGIDAAQTYRENLQECAEITALPKKYIAEVMTAPEM